MEAEAAPARSGRMHRRTALLVTYHVPELDRDSGSRRLTHFVRFLREGNWDVSVLALDGIVAERQARRLRGQGVRVFDGYRWSLPEILDGQPLDLALIAYWPNASRVLPQIRALSPRTRVIVDSVDLHFVRHARRVLRHARDGDAALTEADGAAMAGELNTYAAADAVLTVSQKEAELVNDLVCDPDLAFVVPIYEDMSPSTTAYDDRNGILWLGSFQHPPNRESLAYLCSEILPLVDRDLLHRHPVRVVGNAMDDAVRALANGLSDVEMIGWVPDVQPYLARSAISIIPLLHGAGTKGKLIQALAVGTPTVSTSIGVEGLPLRDREHVLVADDPASFAAAIAELLNDTDLWQRLSEAGPQIADRLHGTAARDAFLGAVRATMGRQVKPPPSWSDPRPRVHSGSQRPGGTQANRRGTRELVADVTRRLPLPLPERLSINPLFDAAWYRQRYGDAPADARRAYRQYRDKVVDERRDPNELFDTAWYLRQNPDVVARGIDPLDHYLRFGGDEGRDPSPRFSTTWYLERNPDVAEAGINPLLHYLRFGRHEGRLAVPPLAPPPTLETPTRPSGPPATPLEPDVRLIAFYLPQFHPIPENDEWWGRGFTEWRSVAAADPLFPGHYQPHVPGELGFYDLRLAETRAAQADLAAGHGIHGFCYYHYWFRGKQLLELPFREVLESDQPRLPFALCWANDPWSRRWDGREEELLMPQDYSADDDLAHIRSLLPALADKRAIRIEGRPIFLVYRGQHLPDPQRTTDVWRSEVASAGLPGIYLIAVETAWDLGWDATRVGFDAKVLFQPQFGWLMTDAARQGAAVRIDGRRSLQVYDYSRVRDLTETIPPVSYRRYESVFPAWDNTPRVGERAVVMQGSTPHAYGEWLRRAVERARRQPPEHRVVFINAWNEWAEGCHLEPDRQHGRAYLEATRSALAAPALS